MHARAIMKGSIMQTQLAILQAIQLEFREPLNLVVRTVEIAG